MDLEPFNEWVVVELEDNQNSENGIYLPNGGDPRAVVTKVGPGGLTPTGTRLEPSVKVGDRVLLRKDRGMKIRFGGRDHLFVTERDFIARISG
jgi:chaperonin GroES